MATATIAKKTTVRKSPAKNTVAKKPRARTIKKVESNDGSWFVWLIVFVVIFFCIKGCSSGPEVTPNDQVKTTITEFKTGGFDMVMIADFTITNNTKQPVKDIEIVCNGYSETKTKIDSNTRTVYKVINPGQTITINDFNMGFIQSAVQSERCKTVKFINA